MMYVWTFSGDSETALDHGLLVTTHCGFNQKFECQFVHHAFLMYKLCKRVSASSVRVSVQICAKLAYRSRVRGSYCITMSSVYQHPLSTLHIHTCSNIEGISCHFILAVVSSTGLIDIIDQKDFVDFTNIISIIFDDICKVQTSLISLFYG